MPTFDVYAPCLLGLRRERNLDYYELRTMS